MSLTLENFSSQYVLTMKGEISHRVELGKDARGNLIRMDNVLNAVPGENQRLQKCSLNLYVGSLKPRKLRLASRFLKRMNYGRDLPDFNELNAELNIDERTPIEKAADTNEKTSVIEKLRNTVPVASSQKRNIDLER